MLGLDNSSLETAQTGCCIAGGGPAGMVLGFLLARAGVDVLVLEKHADFLRDFRGDTIHPSTFELMYELGLLDDFLKRPHQELLSNRRDCRRFPGNRGRFLAFADALQIRRPNAAMGFSELHRRKSESISEVSPADGS